MTIKSNYLLTDLFIFQPVYTQNMQHLYSTIKQKDNPHIQDTRPSHNNSPLSFAHQSQPSKSSQHSSENRNKKLAQEDSVIRFSNGWKFEGQHLAGKFNGWGKLICEQWEVVYKGNFQNGFFHLYGRIKWHVMFAYLFDVGQIKRWLETAINSQKAHKNDLKQIIVTNPQLNKLHSFGKKTKIHSKSQKLSQSFTQQNENFTTIDRIQLIKYQGEFYQGNVSGFGTLKAIVIAKNGGQSQEQKEIKYAKIKIVGKFVQGKIIVGTIKYSNSDV